MSSHNARAAGAEDQIAVILDGCAAAGRLALLVRAIDRRNLWPELAWEDEQAAAGALRDVALVRRALDAAQATAQAVRGGV